MTTLLAAAQALALEAPERTRPGTGWPCCELVGRLLLAVAEAEAVPGWWAQMCVYDVAQPWSPRQAAIDLMGADLDLGAPVIAPSDPARPWEVVPIDLVLDHLHVGRWHVVQRWRRLAADGTVSGITSGGHTILLRYDGDGIGLVLESSVADGVRLCHRPWRSSIPSSAPESILGWLTVAKGGLAICPLWPDV